MNSRVATGQHPVVHCEPLGIARVWFKVRPLQHPAGFGIVLNESGPIIRIVLRIVTDDLPDASVVAGDRVNFLR